MNIGSQKVKANLTRICEYRVAKQRLLDKRLRKESQKRHRMTDHEFVKSGQSNGKFRATACQHRHAGLQR
jgi:hypothetical protein